MRNPILKYSFLFLLVVLFSLTPNLVYSCSCLNNESPQEEIKEADAVFLGTVISFKTIRKNSLPPYRKAAFMVLETYKGVETSEVVINTAIDEGACGYSFEEGRKFLVYAYEYPNPNTLRAGLCSRTSEIESVEEDELIFLRSLTEPQPIQK